jgi:hypothetical protein
MVPTKEVTTLATHLETMWFQDSRMSKMMQHANSWLEALVVKNNPLEEEEWDSKWPNMKYGLSPNEWIKI